MEELNGRIWRKMEELNGRKAERLHPKMVKIRGSRWLRQSIFRKPHTFNSATLKPGCLWLSSSTHSDSISLPARPRNSWGIITKQKQNQSPAPTPQVPARHRPAQGGLATWAQMWHFNLLFLLLLSQTHFNCTHPSSSPETTPAAEDQPEDVLWPPLFSSHSQRGKF